MYVFDMGLPEARVKHEILVTCKHVDDCSPGILVDVSASSQKTHRIVIESPHALANLRNIHLGFPGEVTHFRACPRRRVLGILMKEQHVLLPTVFAPPQLGLPQHPRSCSAH